MQDCKMRIETAGLENAGHGKCRTCNENNEFHMRMPNRHQL